MTGKGKIITAVILVIIVVVIAFFVLRSGKNTILGSGGAALEDLRQRVEAKKVANNFGPYHELISAADWGQWASNYQQVFCGLPVGNTNPTIAAQAQACYEAMPMAHQTFFTTFNIEPHGWVFHVMKNEILEWAAMQPGT